MKVYYLFGAEATDTFYLVEGLPEQQIAEHIKGVPYAVFVWDNQTHPTTLLSAYDGWGDYLVIPQTLYELLCK